MLSPSVRAALEEIASEDDGGIVHAWGDVRIGLDDARRILDAEECLQTLEEVCESGVSAEDIGARLRASLPP